MTLLDSISNADLRSEEYLRSLEQKLDDQIGALTDDTNFSRKLEEAEKFVKRTDEDTLYALKKQCKHDLFFLAFSICQYDRLSILPFNIASELALIKAMASLLISLALLVLRMLEICVSVYLYFSARVLLVVPMIDSATIAS